MSSTLNQEVCGKCNLYMEFCPCNSIGINDKKEVDFTEERLLIYQLTKKNEFEHC